MSKPMLHRKVIRQSIIVGLIVVILTLVAMCSKKQEHYQPTETLPAYQQDSKAKDGDTQADTIKALQAYAKAAVGKATDLNQRTEENLSQVLDNKHQVTRLTQESQRVTTQQQQDTQRLQTLQDQLNALQRQLEQQSPSPSANSDDLPVGFGFDGLTKKINPTKGSWYDPIDRVVDNNSNNNSDTKGNGYQRLLIPRGVSAHPSTTQHVVSVVKPEEQINPAYTLPKDAMLTDAIALTALIGRIPVNGTTPDPYPVKFFVGKENLAANGHILPEVEGMLFSGLGFGDWNLSCVSARILSATFIFTDGTIVNHSQSDTPLGYISDPSGIPCIAGEFVTNAPRFLLHRAGLVGLGTAGAAYADAQQQIQTSALTGNTTRSLLGNIDKVVAGDMLQSATDDINQWLLERQQQSFDAVVVKPGVAVAIHLNTTLTIDHSSSARKLRYANDSAYHNVGLD